MPIVEVEGQEIEFPDSMSREEIKSVLQKKFSAPQTKQQGTAGGSGRAFAYGLSGGQIPFGNVITSGIGAGIAKVASPFTGDERTLGQLYDQAQMDTKATQEANPNATLAGNIAGIVSTLPAAFSKPVQGAGIIATPAKGLQKLGNFTGKMVSATPFKGSGMLAGAGNLGTRMVGGAAVSAPVGGLYAAGEADAGNRMEALGKGARTGAALGAAFPVAGALVGSSLKGVSNAYKGITARGEVALEDALQGIKDASSKLYKATEQAGVLAKPEAAKTLIDDLSGIIKTKDIASQRLYSNTLRSIKDLEDDVLSGNTGLMTLDRHRQILGNISKDIMNPNKAQEAEAAGRAIDVIDDFIDNLTPDKLISGTTEAVDSLVKARSIWAKSKRFEKIASFINNAGNDANKFKRDLEKFRLNPKNTLGWSDAEKEALKAASTQTTGEGVLKALGKFGFDIGSGRAPGNTVGAVIGSAVAGTASGALAPAALVPISGTAARTTHKLITFGKAEELLKVIEQGGKVTNQMVAKLPKSEQKKFLSEVMQMPVAKAQAIFGEKIKPAMQKSKQFAKDYLADESGALTIGGRKDLPVNATQEEFDKILEGNVNRPYLKSWLGQRGISKNKGYSGEQISSIVEDAMDYRRNVILKDVIKKQREVAEKEAIERSERMAYYNSPEYQRKKIAYDLEETENIQSAKDRLKWSVPSVKEVESYHNFYGKDSFNDRFYSNEAAQKATLEAIQREAKKRGIEIVHASGKASAKNASSIYLRHPEFGEVRVSNHELPDTAERAYKREQFGTRWNGEYIIGNDWKKLNLDEIFDKIKKAGLGEE